MALLSTFAVNLGSATFLSAFSAAGGVLREDSMETGNPPPCDIFGGAPLEKRGKFNLIFRRGEGGGLVGSYSTQLTRVKLMKLENHLIHTRLNSRGTLSIGGKGTIRLANHSGKEVVVHVIRGFVRRVEVHPSERKDFSLVFDAEGKLTETFGFGFGSCRLARLQDHRIVKSLNRQGDLTLGGATIVSFPKYPGHLVIAHVKEGQIDPVALTSKTALMEVMELSDLSPHIIETISAEEIAGRSTSSPEQFEYRVFDEASRLVGMIRGRMKNEQFRHIDNGTIVTRLDKTGFLIVGQAVCYALGSHFGKTVAVTLRNNIIVAVDVLSAAIVEEINDWETLQALMKSGERLEFSLILDSKGNLADSFNTFLTAEKFQELQNHILIVRTDSNGLLHLGGQSCGQFKFHKNGIVALTVRDGKIMEAKFLACRHISDVKDLTSLDVYQAEHGVAEFSMIRDAGGKVVKTYLSHLTFMKDYADHTVITRLDNRGMLCLGGRVWAGFYSHPNGVVAARIASGFVLGVHLLDAKKIQDVGEIPAGGNDFSLVFNDMGELVDTYHALLKGNRAANLRGHVIVTQLNPRGGLSYRGRTLATFANAANKWVAVKLREGLITEAAVLQADSVKGIRSLADIRGPAHVRDYYPFSLLYRSDGSLRETYFRRYSRKRFQEFLDGIMVVKLDAEGRVTIGGKARGIWEEHAGRWVALAMEGGIVKGPRPMELKFSSDRFGAYSSEVETILFPGRNRRYYSNRLVESLRCFTGGGLALTWTGS